MGKKRNVKSGGSSYRILQYAWFTGDVTLREAELCCLDICGMSSSATGFRNLVEDGFLRCSSRRKTGDCYEITEEGMAQLVKVNDNYGRKPDSSVWKRFCEKSDSDRELVSMACGVPLNTIIPSKPSFANCVCLLNDTVEVPDEYSVLYPEVGREKLEEVLETGIFYLSAEVRKGLEEVGIDTEPFNDSRMSGLALTSDDIYVFYRYVGKMYLLDRDTEAMMLEAVRRAFPSYRRLPVCVVTGKGYMPAAAISMGSPGGKLSRQRGSSGTGDSFLRHRHDPRMLTGETRLFREIYYVPAEPRHIETLFDITGTNIEKLSGDAALWFESHDGFTPASALEGRNPSTGTDAVYLPVVECRTLTRLRNGAGRYLVVTRPEIADVISRILGPNAAGFIGADGTVLEGIQKYDTLGYPVDSRRHDIGMEAKKAAEDRERNGFVKKIPVSMKVDPEIRDDIAGLSAELGIDRSALCRKILDFALKDHLDEFMDSLGRH